MNTKLPPPLQWKIAAWYLLIAAAVSIGFWLPIASSIRTAFQAGRLARVATLDIAAIVAGIGILRGHGWGRHVGIAVLIADTFYGAASFAEGYAEGRPTAGVVLFSLALSTMWHGIFLLLLLKRRAATSVPLELG